MAGQTFYTIGPGLLGKLRDVARNPYHTPGAAGVPSDTDSNRFELVKVTTADDDLVDDTPADGVVMTYDPDSDYAAGESSIVCKIREGRSKESELKTGQVYLARFTGTLDDVPVYETIATLAGKSKCVELVTDVTCSGGMVGVSKKWFKVFGGPYDTQELCEADE